ncbi:MAG: caspase family protein [Ferruginibacter sp.]
MTNNTLSKAFFSIGKSLFLLAAGCFVYSNSFSQTKQLALIIGINEYKPSLNDMASAASDSKRTWTNLDGCVNDATAIRDLAISKYSFQPENITTLFNAEASRARIIAELEKLIATAQKGDVVFIYYAGHGSQVKNSLSTEVDKKDETIVPADAWRKGVPDIRDKELAKYFNLLLDKGVLLTVIMDSCHSGSGSRGDNFLYDPPKARYIEDANYDAKDPSIPDRPEERGALIMAAAQDFEFAKEHRDENNQPHGAFTSALLKAAQQLSVDASANDLYVSLSAIMKYYGKTQEPSVAGSMQRKNGTLFALPKGTLKNKFAVPVSRLEAKGVELQGGFAFGLNEGILLANGKDTLQVIEMRGANRSLAKVVSGVKEKILPGTMFEVVNWASSKAPALKVYIPEAVNTKQLQEYVAAYKAARAAKKINWVSDISKAHPDKIFSYENGWYLSDKKAGRKKMDAFTSAALQSSLSGASSAFVSMPPAAELYDAMSRQFSGYNNISIVNNPNESQYSLIGTVNDKNELEYALVKTQVTVQDTTESLPAITDFVAAGNAQEAAAQLSEYAFRIAKIRDWLMLEGPKGTNKFPFRLSFQGYTSGDLIQSDMVKVGDTLSIFFEEDKAEGGWRSNYAKRYIYVFSIDSKGNTNLLFPSIESGNVENRFPVTNADNSLAEPRTHIADIVVVPPMGADNYFILSTEQAIGNLSVFQQEGVLKRSAVEKGRGEYNPLEDLLFTGTKTRNASLLTPVTWGITKTILRTR